MKKNEIQYEVNGLNQLLGQGDSGYQYDSNGNLKNESNDDRCSRYCYDALDRLVEVCMGNEKVNYTYDHFHRRLAKKVSHKHENEWKVISDHRYLYQGDKEIGLIDNQGKIIEFRVLGAGSGGDVGAAIAIEIEERVLIPLHSYRGDVIQLIDPLSRKMVEKYRYSAYDEEEIFDENGYQLSSALSPWCYSSKRFDKETGWSYFGRRYYDSSIGRWTTPDPMGYVDGPNLYGYVQNRPTGFVDPDGLYMVDIHCLNRKRTGKRQHCSFESFDSILAMRANQKYWGYDSLTQQPSCSMVYKTEGEVKRGVLITFVNGILNSYEDAVSSAKLISQYSGGCQVVGVYNKTHAATDILEAGLNLLRVDTTPVFELTNLWREFLNENDENAKIVHICHSQGAIISRNAIELLDSEEQQKINILCVAPAAYVDKENCHSVTHLISQGRDFVPFFDNEGRIRCAETVIYLPPHPEAPLWDHSFGGVTYANKKKEFLDDNL